MFESVFESWIEREWFADESESFESRVTGFADRTLVADGGGEALGKTGR